LSGDIFRHAAAFRAMLLSFSLSMFSLFFDYFSPPYLFFAAAANMIYVRFTPLLMLPGDDAIDDAAQRAVLRRLIKSALA